MANPDTLWALYAPGFAGLGLERPEQDLGRSIRADAAPVVPLFAVTAIDNNGDYGPCPRLTGTSSSSWSTTTPASTRDCVSRLPSSTTASRRAASVDVAYEIPDGAGVRVQWVEIPAIARRHRRVSLGARPAGPDRSQDRDNPNQDPNHWSGWSLGATSTIVGPFTDDVATEHVLYIQVGDDVDRRSMVRIHFTLARMTHERDLLVVDDTRLHSRHAGAGRLDRRRRAAYGPPPRSWMPSSTRAVDTSGGAIPGDTEPPWPDGRIPLDTLGTIGLVGGVVPLSVLGRYRHVIWFTDDVGATYTNPPGFALAPTTSLRLMSSPGAYSTLAAYVGQGVRCGSRWRRGVRDPGELGQAQHPPDDWTNADLELIPGRFMYDAPHWQSAIAVRPGRRRA